MDNKGGIGNDSKIVKLLNVVTKIVDKSGFVDM